MGKIKTIFILLSVFLGLVSCGVKGDPLPPEPSAEIGRGRPAFRKAMETVSEDAPPNFIEEPDDDEDDDETDDDDSGDQE